MIVEFLMSHVCCMFQRLVRETDQTIILDDIKELKVLSHVAGYLSVDAKTLKEEVKKMKAVLSFPQWFLNFQFLFAMVPLDTPAFFTIVCFPQ